MTSFNNVKFEEEWVKLGREICQTVYTNPRVQQIKFALEKNGFLTLDQKSEFINICDTTKYECIYKKYGPEDSEGYKEFSDAWKNWFQEKGVSSLHHRGQRNSVDHILFGSTPDPTRFLLNFEEEMLGSMTEKI
jgi:hypothetical protein